MSKTIRKKDFDAVARGNSSIADLGRRVQKFVRQVHPFIKNGACFCANRWWYGYGEGQNGGIRGTVHGLTPVGEKGSWQIRDVVQGYLYDILPGCTHEGGCGVLDNDIGYWADR